VNSGPVNKFICGKRTK